MIYAKLDRPGFIRVYTPKDNGIYVDRILKRDPQCADQKAWLRNYWTKHGFKAEKYSGRT